MTESETKPTGIAKARAAITQANAARTRRPSNFARCTITQGEAMLAYLEMKPKPSVRGLARLLQNQGHKVSEGTISKWANKHKWVKHMDTQRKVLDSEVLGVIKIMNVEGENIKETAFKGAQARLIAHLGRAINKVECKTPKDVLDLLEACEKLRSMIHTVRGDQFGDVRKTSEALTGGPAAPQLGSFKPKVVSGSGNGSSHE